MASLDRGMRLVWCGDMLHVSHASAVHADAPGPIRLSRPDERRRLDRHFRRVLRQLRGHTPAGLSRSARRRRAEHIAELERYRRRGRFPLNEHHPGRRLPIFVDAHGTRCAMGHLLDRAGGGAIVDFVAAHHNLARVHDLAALPAFMAWLTANGLTVDEAALIQPAYCEAPADCTCSEIQGQSFVVGTVANATTGAGGGGGASDGLVLVVSDVYGNAGFEVGDEIELAPWNDIGVGDQIIADLGSFGTTLGTPRKIVDGEVAMRTCGLQASPPGPLPLDVFANAALSADQGACKDTLGAHDPAWNQATGQGCGGNPSDPGPEEDEDEGSTVVTNDGCSFHPAVPGASTGGLWLLGAAGLVLLRRRRS